MSTINIRKAQREGARLVFGFVGVSGGGKTYSAIQLAYGLAGYNAAKVGVLDSENRRAGLMADILERATRPTKERFMVADLVAPFSPARYAEAIRTFQDAGTEVLVIDSVTHEWAGVGGCDDIANDGDPKVARWNKAKREHKRFMNALLQCDMHVVACVRAQEKVRIEKDKDGKAQFIPVGLQPVQEKAFAFELTASVMVHDQGRRYDVLKMPHGLHQYFPGDAYITADSGYAIRQWVAGGGQVDPHVEKYRNRLLSVTEQGVRYIETAWQKVPLDIRAALGESFYSEIEASAREFDRQRADLEQPETVATINRQVAHSPMGQPLDFSNPSYVGRDHRDDN